jgi:hypothetical protein
VESESPFAKASEDKRDEDFDEEECRSDRQSLLRWNVGSIVTIVFVLFVLLTFMKAV